MAINFMIPLRIAQAILAILVLALSAYVASWYNNYTSVVSPSQVNFLIFASCWTTFLIVPYLTLSPRYLPQAAHKYGILAAEVVTMLFWFSGFIALAVFLSHLVSCRGHVCNAARAATAFGAFEWVLFSATTILATVHVVKSRQTYSEKRPATSQLPANGV